MIKKVLITASMVTGLLWPAITLAVDSGYPPSLSGNISDSMGPWGMEPPPLRTLPGTRMDFPTPQEMARLVPPEPVTESIIRERFAKRRQILTEMLQQDRIAAEQYATDFARYQAEQASRLKQMMAQAEKQREAILKQLDAQEQRALEHFQQNTTANESTEPTVSNKQ